MKKIIFVTIVFIFTFLIYYLNIDKDIYYVSLGDQLSQGVNNYNKIEYNYNIGIKHSLGSKLKKYVNYSVLEDYRVNDLINDINYNKTINYNNKEYKLQNLIIKSNYIVISIGMNDLIYTKNLNYNYVDSLLLDIEKLIILLRKYNKDKIYFLSFYNIINNKELIEYTNKKLSNICRDNKINYIDISNLDKYIINGIYPTIDGYYYITDKIINFTK